MTTGRRINAKTDLKKRLENSTLLRKELFVKDCEACKVALSAKVTLPVGCSCVGIVMLCV